MFDKKLFLTFLLLALVVTIICVYVVGLYNARNPVIDLEGVEVREYEGRDLSSISDFRENSIRGPQYVDNQTYSLAVTGLVDHQLEYTYDDVINFNQHFKKVVTLHCVEGWSVTLLWEGVLVEDLIEEAGVNPEATTVIFYAYDGYSTSLSLDYIRDNDIMMAYKMNNVTLPPERGFPFQLVAESKYGYKWIKWVTAIELSDNEDYRGYWESRGYSKEGNLGESFFEARIPEFSSWIIVPLVATITVILIIIYGKRLSQIKD